MPDTLTDHARRALDQFDGCIAVDRVLYDAHRAAFETMMAHGPAQGMAVADWISEARNADHALNITEPWWEKHGDTVIAALTESRLPGRARTQIVSSALYACIAVGLVEPDRDGVLYVMLIAVRAGWWAAGHLEAQGWQPGTDPGEPHDDPAASGAQTFTARWTPAAPLTPREAAQMLQLLPATRWPLPIHHGVNGPVVGHVTAVRSEDDAILCEGTFTGAGRGLFGLDEVLHCSLQPLLGAAELAAHRSRWAPRSRVGRDRD